MSDSIGQRREGEEDEISRVGAGVHACMYPERRGGKVRKVLTVFRDDRVSRSSSLVPSQLKRSNILPRQISPLSDDPQLPNFILSKIVDPELPILSRHLHQLMRVRAFLSSSISERSSRGSEGEGVEVRRRDGRVGCGGCEEAG